MVINAESRPLIASSLNLQSVDENGKPVDGIDNDHWMSMQTDDRGIYRVYGLSAGRYIISAGGDFITYRPKSKYPRMMKGGSGSPDYHRGYMRCYWGITGAHH